MTALRQAIRQMKVLSANDEEIQTAMKEAIRQVEEEGFSGD